MHSWVKQEAHISFTGSCYKYIGNSVCLRRGQRFGGQTYKQNTWKEVGRHPLCQCFGVNRNFCGLFISKSEIMKHVTWQRSWVVKFNKHVMADGIISGFPLTLENNQFSAAVQPSFWNNCKYCKEEKQPQLVWLQISIWNRSCENE